MKRTAVPIVLALSVSACSFAYTGFNQTGAIIKIDPTAVTVTLDTGRTFVLPATVDIAKLNVGDKVSINFTMQTDGKNHASAVKSLS